jgi:hypothetical protein
VLAIRGGATGFSRWFSSSKTKEEQTTVNVMNADSPVNGESSSTLTLIRATTTRSSQVSTAPATMNGGKEDLDLDRDRRREFMLVAPKQRSLSPSHGAASGALVPKSTKPKSEMDSYFLSDEEVNEYMTSHQAVLANSPFAASNGNGASGNGQQGGDANVHGGSWLGHLPKVSSFLPFALLTSSQLMVSVCTHLYLGLCVSSLCRSISG